MHPAVSKDVGKPADARLLKTLEKETAPVGLPTLFAPVLFGFIETMVLGYLREQSNSQSAREYVAHFAFSLRKEAYARFGHDTPETFRLAAILKPKIEPTLQARVDAITFIQAYRRKEDRLSIQQETAAEKIKAVWAAFERTRRSQSSFRPSGARRTSVSTPLDGMSDELWLHYRRIYTPWYEDHKVKMVERLAQGTKVSVVALVLKVLVEDRYPEEVDHAWSLPKGQTLHSLKAALSAYWFLIGADDAE